MRNIFRRIFAPSRSHAVPPPNASTDQQPIVPPADVGWNLPPPRPRRAKKSVRRSCGDDFRNVLAVVCFLISIIFKAVSYNNSHWMNHEQIDFNNNKDKFPIMTNFIDMKNGKFESNCEGIKCKIFFDKYNALQMVSAAQGKPNVPLEAIFSRGVNSRCETVVLPASSEAQTDYGYKTSGAKYEKCIVDKHREVNEYRTIRDLLVASMISDGLAVIVLGVLFFKPTQKGVIRMTLVVAAIIGFVSALMTLLSLGLFTQAIDIYDEALMSLGWPFYITLLAAGLVVVALFVCISLLNKYRDQQNRATMVTSGYPGYPGGGQRPHPPPPPPHPHMIEISEMDEQPAVAHPSNSNEPNYPDSQAPQRHSNAPPYSSVPQFGEPGPEKKGPPSQNLDGPSTSKTASRPSYRESDGLPSSKKPTAPLAQFN